MAPDLIQQADDEGAMARVTGIGRGLFYPVTRVGESLRVAEVGIREGNRIALQEGTQLIRCMVLESFIR